MSLITEYTMTAPSIVISRFGPPPGNISTGPSSAGALSSRRSLELLETNLPSPPMDRSFSSLSFASGHPSQSDLSAAFKAQQTALPVVRRTPSVKITSLEPIPKKRIRFEPKDPRLPKPGSTFDIAYLLRNSGPPPMSLTTIDETDMISMTEKSSIRGFFKSERFGFSMFKKRNREKAGSQAYDYEERSSTSSACQPFIPKVSSQGQSSSEPGNRYLQIVTTHEMPQTPQLRAISKHLPLRSILKKISSSVPTSRAESRVSCRTSCDASVMSIEELESMIPSHQFAFSDLNQSGPISINRTPPLEPLTGEAEAKPPIYAAIKRSMVPGIRPFVDGAIANAARRDSRDHGANRRKLLHILPSSRRQSTNISAGRVESPSTRETFSDGARLEESMKNAAYEQATTLAPPTPEKSPERLRNATAKKASLGFGQVSGQTSRFPLSLRLGELLPEPLMLSQATGPRFQLEVPLDSPRSPDPWGEYVPSQDSRDIAIQSPRAQTSMQHQLPSNLSSRAGSPDAAGQHSRAKSSAPDTRFAHPATPRPAVIVTPASGSPTSSRTASTLRGKSLLAASPPVYSPFPPPPRKSSRLPTANTSVTTSRASSRMTQSPSALSLCSLQSIEETSHAIVPAEPPARPAAAAGNYPTMTSTTELDREPLPAKRRLPRKAEMQLLSRLEALERKNRRLEAAVAALLGSAHGTEYDNEHGHDEAAETRNAEILLLEDDETPRASLQSTVRDSSPRQKRLLLENAPNLDIASNERPSFELGSVPSSTRVSDQKPDPRTLSPENAVVAAVRTAADSFEDLSAIDGSVAIPSPGHESRLFEFESYLTPRRDSARSVT